VLGPETERASLRARIVERAISEIGDVETDGNNRGPAPRKFLASVGLGEGHPYCGAGIYWCYREEGDTLLPARQFALAAKWHPVARRIRGKGALSDTTAILPADITGHWFESMNGIHHVNLIVQDKGKYLDIVGFNTTDGFNRDGTGVYRKLILKGQASCVSRWIENAP